MRIGGGGGGSNNNQGNVPSAPRLPTHPTMPAHVATIPVATSIVPFSMPFMPSVPTSAPSAVKARKTKAKRTTGASKANKKIVVEEVVDSNGDTEMAASQSSHRPPFHPLIPPAHSMTPLMVNDWAVWEAAHLPQEQIDFVPIGNNDFDDLQSVV